jgi:ABC-type transport system involved in cytochrome c biogenesis permease subunit
LVLSKEVIINPSLQTIWLIIHVPFGLIAYGFFAISFILSLVYIIYHRVKVLEKNKFEMYYKTTLKLIILGSIFLFLNIITGAIWANFTWGSFWGWDPKETWSLITLIAYLFSILSYSFNKKRKIINISISMISFILVIFNYFIVNFLIYGLHSYL